MGVADSTHHRRVEIVCLERRSRVQHSHSHLPSEAGVRMHPAPGEGNCTAVEAQRWVGVDSLPGCNVPDLARAPELDPEAEGSS
jgi:hypothetical protein